MKIEQKFWPETRSGWLVQVSRRIKGFVPQLLACVLARRSSNKECIEGDFKLLGTADNHTSVAGASGLNCTLL
jgi:hypothetical protein